MKKLLLAVLLFGLMLAAFAVVSHRPSMPPENTLSYELLQPGPFDVATGTMELVDPSRFVAAPGDPSSKSERRMPVHLWYPLSENHSPQPLLIYSHGFMSTGEGIAYLTDVLASQGYVVAAPDFPITGRSRGEEANSRDVLNQPRDVALLIDALLARSQDESDALYNRIDGERIAAIGYSLGALNTLLLGFHPTLQEPRIKAVISLAGPTEVFTRKFLNTRVIPFMAIAATEDAFVGYEANFLSLRDKVDDAILVTFERGSHLGFAEEGKWVRWFDQPDSLACDLAMETIDKNRKSEEPWYDELGGIEEGYVQKVDPDVCENEVSSAMNPLRQQQLTLMAVRSFLACQFEEDPAERARWCEYLSGALARENEEISVGRPAP